MKVGFTGTQFGMTREQMRTLDKLFFETFRDHHEVEFHHGDCIGADAQAHEIFCRVANVIEAPASIIIHPPTDPKKRAWCDSAPWRIPLHIRARMPYLDRNKAIVDGADFLIACPQTFEEKVRSGTWSTVRYARRTKVQILIIQPTGVVKNEVPVC